MPNISWSCVGYFRSTEANILEAKVMGYQMLSCFCSINPLEATKDASENIHKGSVDDAHFKTGWEVKTILRASRA